MSPLVKTLSRQNRFSLCTLEYFICCAHKQDCVWTIGNVLVIYDFFKKFSNTNTVARNTFSWVPHSDVMKSCIGFSDMRTWITKGNTILYLILLIYSAYIVYSTRCKCIPGHFWRFSNGFSAPCNLHLMYGIHIVSHMFCRIIYKFNWWNIRYHDIIQRGDIMQKVDNFRITVYCILYERLLHE